VELLAGWRLRDRLSLRDGSAVTLAVALEG
jgi:hypothetical protein